MEKVTEGSERRLRIGLFVFITLVLLTGVEFAISARLASPLPVLLIIALIKAYLIIRYFMHVRQLWQKEA